MNRMKREEWHDLKDRLLEDLYETFTVIDFHYLHGDSKTAVMYYALEDLEIHLDAMRQEFSELHDREKEIRKMKADSTEPAKVKS